MKSWNITSCEKMKALKYYYHYFEKANGPLLNLSKLPLDEAGEVMERIRAENKAFAAKRDDGYLRRRKELETLARKLFIEKKGKPRSSYPHYFVIGECKWLESWYKEPGHIKIPIESVPPEIVSFTYGDMFPIFSDKPNKCDGKEYRRSLYTFGEILELIDKYGLPQNWNANGECGPERYIEAHIWNENILDLAK